jgi:hypothetical protein
MVDGDEHSVPSSMNNRAVKHLTVGVESWISTVTGRDPKKIAYSTVALSTERPGPIVLATVIFLR